MSSHAPVQGVLHIGMCPNWNKGNVVFEASCQYECVGNTCAPAGRRKATGFRNCRHSLGVSA